MEKKTKLTKRKKFMISLALSASMLAGAGTYVGINAHKVNNRFSEVDTSRFSKSIFNVPQTLPIENGTVKINIKNVFSPDQMEQIKKGIEDLDAVAENINYEIHFNENNLKKAINIETYKRTDFTTRQKAFAAFQIHKLNQFSAEIQYPITIKINQNVINQRYELDKVIKHELLHSLGFADLDKTQNLHDLMFFEYRGNDISDNEANMINTIYSKEYTGLVETELPTSIEYVDLINENELVF